ncbi:MAG: ZIP family metal transporter [Anaerolineae bacterium]|nr:ZIP family metal transporter [Anaerolineae bacterium]MDK1118513.1 ZIP family metal transporter [Anaerolineae bacterium]
MEILIGKLGDFSLVEQGLFGGFVIAGLNMLGALLVFVWRQPSEKFLNAALGLAAGVMLTASFTSLILPGIEYGGIWPVIIGILLGATLLLFVDQWIPHQHFIKGREGPKNPRLKAMWLFIFAITLHNMPEGLAVGVAFGSGNLPNALSLMWAIGIQNIPEGYAVSISARNAGLSNTFYASFAGIRSGLVEIPLAVLGAFAVQYAKPILPYAMGFAAGAMLFVISHEIIPETHRQGHERAATIGLILGVIIMLYLDVTLG